MHSPETAHPLHPPIAPYASAQVDVGDGHSLYVEQCGNPNGMPMVYLHGGPGSGCSPRHRQFFNPELCRSVLFDQRGCGRSQPRGALQHNHTEALVNDIETLRRHLGIARWLMVGGSWGAGLALTYAAAHPEACLGLVLRGVFLGRATDIDWFFQGAAQLLPDAWQQLADQAPANAGADVLAWLHAGLHGPDGATALACATAWEAWEQSLSLQRAVAPRVLAEGAGDAALLLDKYRIQSHYLIHQCFREAGGLLPRGGALAGLPTAILQGRLDWICRAQAAWDVHQCLTASRLHWVQGCGHNPFEFANAAALVASIQHFATHGNFSAWGTAFPHPPAV
ncbi:MAG TPA: prolyl aminopeptidase [Rhodoferax sp.]